VWESDDASDASNGGVEAGRGGYSSAVAVKEKADLEALRTEKEALRRSLHDERMGTAALGLEVRLQALHNDLVHALLGRKEEGGAQCSETQSTTEPLAQRGCSPKRSPKRGDVGDGENDCASRSLEHELEMEIEMLIAGDKEKGESRNPVHLQTERAAPAERQSRGPGTGLGGSTRACRKHVALLEDQERSRAIENDDVRALLVGVHASHKAELEEVHAENTRTRRSLEKKSKRYRSERDRLGKECAELRGQVAMLNSAEWQLAIRTLGNDSSRKSASAGATEGTRAETQLKVRQFEDKISTLHQEKRQLAFAAKVAKEAQELSQTEIRLLHEKVSALELSQEALARDAAHWKGLHAALVDRTRAPSQDLQQQREGALAEALARKQKELAEKNAEAEEMGAKQRASDAEVARLRRIVADFEPERVSHAALRRSLAESHKEVQALKESLDASRAAIADHEREIAILKSKEMAWQEVHAQFVAVKIDNEKMAKAQIDLVRNLENSASKIAALDRERDQLLGSLTTVSKVHVPLAGR